MNIDLRINTYIENKQNKATITISRVEMQIHSNCGRNEYAKHSLFCTTLALITLALWRRQHHHHNHHLSLLAWNSIWFLFFDTIPVLLIHIR